MFDKNLISITNLFVRNNNAYIYISQINSII